HGGLPDQADPRRDLATADRHPPRAVASSALAGRLGSAASLGSAAGARSGGRTPVIAASADAGSNSVHLFVAVASSHLLEPIFDESAFLGLGAAVDERGRLGKLKRAELASTMARFTEIARNLGAESI